MTFLIFFLKILIFSTFRFACFSACSSGQCHFLELQTVFEKKIAWKHISNTFYLWEKKVFLQKVLAKKSFDHLRMSVALKMVRNVTFEPDLKTRTSSIRKTVRISWLLFNLLVAQNRSKHCTPLFLCFCVFWEKKILDQHWNFEFVTKFLRFGRIIGNPSSYMSRKKVLKGLTSCLMWSNDS